MSANKMMMKPKNCIPVLLLGWLLLSGCAEKTDEPAPTTNTDLITRSWQVDAVQIDGNPDETTDFRNYRFTFRADHTYRFDLADIQTGNWEFTSGETALLLDRDTEIEHWVNIFELTETSLHLEFTQENNKTGTERTRYELIP